MSATARYGRGPALTAPTGSSHKQSVAASLVGAGGAAMLMPGRPRSQSWMLRAHNVYKKDDKGMTEGAFVRLMTLCSWVLIVLTFPISLFFCLKVIKEYERVVMFRLGRLKSGGPRGPGIFFYLPCMESFRKVDLRTVSFDVPPQEILSKDSVTVSVDAVVFIRISNPVISVTNVNDATYSTKLLAQTTLRNVLGTKTLSEILSERENIAQVTEKALDEGTDPWGVKVERVEMKDIRLPHSMMRSMAVEAEAAREARAKVVAAEGEKRASKYVRGAHPQITCAQVYSALTMAAAELSKSPTAVQLRYLQTLKSIACEHDSTILFPVPMQFRLLMAGYGTNDGHGWTSKGREAAAAAACRSTAPARPPPLVVAAGTTPIPRPSLSSMHRAAAIDTSAITSSMMSSLTSSTEELTTSTHSSA